MPVIGYASGETVGGATTGVRILLGLLSALHLLMGGRIVAWTIASMIGRVFSPAITIWAIVGVIVGGIDVVCGIWMLVRRPWTWRAAHLALTVLCVIDLLVCIGGAAIIISYKLATGWDGIAFAIGVTLVLAGSALFWLHAVSKLALLPTKVRRAFSLGDDESARLHAAATLVLMILYVATLSVGSLWYVLKQ